MTGETKISTIPRPLRLGKRHHGLAPSGLHTRASDQPPRRCAATAEATGDVDVSPPIPRCAVTTASAAPRPPADRSHVRGSLAIVPVARRLPGGGRVQAPAYGGGVSHREANSGKQGVSAGTVYTLPDRTLAGAGVSRRLVSEERDAEHPADRTSSRLEPVRRRTAGTEQLTRMPATGDAVSDPPEQGCRIVAAEAPTACDRLSLRTNLNTRRFARKHPAGGALIFCA